MSCDEVYSGMSQRERKKKKSHERVVSSKRNNLLLYLFISRSEQYFTPIRTNFFLINIFVDYGEQEMHKQGPHYIPAIALLASCVEARA